MRACASLSTTAFAGPSPGPRPLVFVNGAPEPGLLTIEFRSEGPLDRRLATVVVAGAEDSALTMSRWLSGVATLALPLRLIDEQARWVVLLHGELAEADRRLSGRKNEHVLELVDGWSKRLSETLTAVWWQTDDGRLIEETTHAVIRTGTKANRSASTWLIGSSPFHVFQKEGLPWTVGSALGTVSALADLRLGLGLIPNEIKDLPIVEEVDLTQSLAEVLENILEPHGLLIQRDLMREAGVILERRSVRALGQGRIVELGWPGEGRPDGHVIEVTAQRPARRAEPWTAQADGWLVESTFTLAGGWDPSLEGQPDNAYSKTSNPQFAVYANVYRLWVLNEDGAFSASPYNRGGPFDLTGFFGQRAIRPQPLRFLPCLTLDDGGSRRSPIVEMSLDHGLSWSVYPGSLRLLTDRAGVYFDDSNLPGSFLTAAKLGMARVRVTAGLQSPLPVSVTRWTGNPFQGTGRGRLFDLGGALTFAEVAPESIHYDQVRAGALSALEANDTHRLHDWLVRRLNQTAEAHDDKVGRARLRLAGPWPLLRVGDRLINAAGDGTDAAGQPEAIVSEGAIVRAIRCTWAEETFPWDWQPKPTVHRPPLTELELMF